MLQFRVIPEGPAGGYLCNFENAEHVEQVGKAVETLGAFDTPAFRVFPAEVGGCFKGLSFKF